MSSSNNNQPAFIVDTSSLHLPLFYKSALKLTVHCYGFKHLFYSPFGFHCSLVFNKKKKTGAERLMAVGVHLLKGNVGFAEVKECTLQLNVNREIE